MNAWSKLEIFLFPPIKNVLNSINIHFTPKNFYVAKRGRGKFLCVKIVIFCSQNNIHSHTYT